MPRPRPSPNGMPDRTRNAPAMSIRRLTRRSLLARAAVAACAVMYSRPARSQGVAGRVVVIGGGFAGTTGARTLKRLDPRLSVTLVEPNETFPACPFSHGVIAGLRDLRDQEFT